MDKSLKKSPNGQQILVEGRLERFMAQNELRLARGFERELKEIVQ